MQLTYILALLFCVGRLCNGDIYMHNPRGSNNRLNEKTATRTTNNRMFDSQNNNRGGYNIGDETNVAGNTEEKFYRMEFFQSSVNMNPGSDSPNGRSVISLEWTNQHGCGGNEDTDPQKANCNIVIQMMCQDDIEQATKDDGITLRDGKTTDRQNYDRINSESTKSAFVNKRNGNSNQNRGVNEPWWSYDACARRERNKGLFLATQDLQGDTAVYTRQNANGDRNGWECPEERDYFPYWHPTVWTDIAILAQNESMCQYYDQHSFNREPKGLCVEEFSTGERKHFSEFNNKESCEETEGRTWVEYYQMLELAPEYTSQADCEKDHNDNMSYKWGLPLDSAKIDNHEDIVPVCFVQPSPIDCQAAGWTRTNHLGNGRDGQPLQYDWTLPYFPSGKDKRCVLRIRYNISTDDYDPWGTFASNGEDVIGQNPLVEVTEDSQPLRLAINTAQTGRTFQDRSHIFKLIPRTSTFDPDARVLNLNVRGKRGNIVQTFPAVEYDYVPTRLEMRKNLDYVHLQWTGSNTHNNNAPAGDGQSGSAGEGTAGTDRHNLCQMKSADGNYPLPVESMTMFKDAEVIWSYNGDNTLTKENLELILATNGYYECFDNSCTNSVETRTQLQNQLNNANASFRGVVLKFTSENIFHFLCTRNNNFTNRSQKGKITVTAE